MSGWRGVFGRSGFDDRRWVVLDVESSGLDAARDRLLAIAAIAVRRGDDGPRITLGDSFEVVLRHDRAPIDKPNILVHGIGVGAQREGVEADTALEAFERWVGASPLIAFHSAFDETLIRRAMQERLGRRLRSPWADLAQVADVVRPDVRARSLDEWMLQFGIRCTKRHQAAADALATAELLLQLWPRARAQAGRRDGFAALQWLAAQRAWIR